MRVYRDSAGEIHTRLEAISLARVAIAESVGDPELTAFRLDKAATANQHEQGFPDQTIYRAVLCPHHVPNTIGNVVSACYAANDGLLFVAEGDNGPPFDPDSMVEAWQRVDTLTGQ
jgi:hypothetical protein